MSALVADQYPTDEEFGEFELRPVQRTDGSGLWDAFDAHGHGYALGLQYAASVSLWLSGYRVGSEDNQ